MSKAYKKICLLTIGGMGLLSPLPDIVTSCLRKKNAKDLEHFQGINNCIETSPCTDYTNHFNCKIKKITDDNPAVSKIPSLVGEIKTIPKGIPTEIKEKVILSLGNPIEQEETIPEEKIPDISLDSSLKEIDSLVVSKEDSVKDNSNTFQGESIEKIEETEEIGFFEEIIESIKTFCSDAFSFFKNIFKKEEKKSMEKLQTNPVRISDTMKEAPKALDSIPPISTDSLANTSLEKEESIPNIDKLGLNKAQKIAILDFLKNPSRSQKNLPNLAFPKSLEKSFSKENIFDIYQQNKEIIPLIISELSNKQKRVLLGWVKKYKIFFETSLTPLIEEALENNFSKIKDKYPYVISIDINQINTVLNEKLEKEIFCTNLEARAFILKKAYGEKDPKRILSEIIELLEK